MAFITLSGWSFGAADDLREGEFCALDRKLLKMSASVIDDFVQMVIYDHSVATGLKSCKTDQDIVDFAASRDYFFSITAWLQYVESDSVGLSESEALAIQAISNDHWSWAFRKIAPWRAMLMDGA